MKVMIVGSGGREHALAWKMASSRHVSQVFVAPGNPGTAAEAKVTNVAIPVSATDELCAFARDNGIELTVVGPEAPLVAGLADRLLAAGLPCLGPSAMAAQLEGSKAFSKDFMRRHSIPTAAYATFSDAKAAQDYIKTQRMPQVVKASGLAAGKGVVIAHTQAEADAAVDAVFAGCFGDGEQRVVIEDYLEGEELSFIVLADGQHCVVMASAQDHKARYEADCGPNTGGMGAYSPAPVLTPVVHDRVMQHIIQPTLAGMRAMGAPYVGFLYAGVMVTPSGEPKLLEFNCRLGDPEAQVMLLRLRSDLVEVCQAAVQGRLDEVAMQWDPRPAVGVVMAADGYPAAVRQGDPIQGLQRTLPDDCKIFHAGTRQERGEILTAGGRVLCCTALGETVLEAQQRAYRMVSGIQWNGAGYRRDIGYRAIAREQHSASD